MAKRILQIVESAYRGTLEEQDDTVVWLTHAMKGAGAELSLLLQGHAVNYAVRQQDASGLSFGDRRQTQPPRIHEDLARLVDKGVAVHLVREDLEERGIDAEELIPGARPIAFAELPRLCAEHDLVWRW